MRERLLVEAAAFREYLGALQQELSSYQSKLALLPDEELRSFAFLVLDDPTTLDESDPRGFLSRAVSQKSTAVMKLEEGAESLQSLVDESTPEMNVRLTLLNRGASDGLVRHRGKITYRGSTYDMVRTAPPSAEVNSFAVPVFQTNAADEYPAGSIGKIEKDSMAEFWYSFHLEGEQYDPRSSSVCRPGETVDVILLDQNRTEVAATLECNQEQD
jgi:hypothetical protein